MNDLDISNKYQLNDDQIAAGREALLIRGLGPVITSYDVLACYNAVINNAPNNHKAIYIRLGHSHKFYNIT